MTQVSLLELLHFSFSMSGLVLFVIPIKLDRKTIEPTSTNDNIYGGPEKKEKKKRKYIYRHTLLWRDILMPYLCYNIMDNHYKKISL